MTGTTQARYLHKFLLLNIAVGILVVAGALYFIITGEYASLLERQYTEGLLNRVALAALLYSVFAWYADAYFSPRCKTRSAGYHTERQVK